MSELSTVLGLPGVERVIEYLPTLFGAAGILAIGLIVGKFLGGVVARLARRAGIGHYTDATGVQGVDRNDGIARGIGKLVAYYVYLVALLAAADVLGIQELTDLLSTLGSYAPVVLGALAVLIVGFIAGRVIGELVAGLVSDFGVGRYLRETPLEDVGDEYSLSYLVGKVVTYYVYLLSLLAAADILNVDALSALLNRFASYLPALTAGLLVLLVGIWLAERAAAIVEDSDDGRATYLASLGVKLLVYYVTVTIALSTLGIDVSVLTDLFTTVVVTFFGALGLALAIGVGLAFGLGGQEFVAENIDDWAASITGTLDEEEDDPGGFQYE
jgi:hypothetical protein